MDRPRLIHNTHLPRKDRDSFRGFFFAQKEEDITKNQENPGTYHAISVSGGKDSSALLLLMIERDMPIDIALSADVGMEFPEMYEHLAKLDDLLYRERGIHITTLWHPHGFEWLMFDYPVNRAERWKHIPPYGYRWPGMKKR